jgi:hypothetical protein
MIKQTGVVIHSVKYPITPSVLNGLALKGTHSSLLLNLCS